MSAPRTCPSTRLLPRSGPSGPGRGEPVLEPAQQLGEIGAEAGTGLPAEAGQHGALVGELLGQQPVEEDTAVVGEPDVGDAAVTRLLSAIAGQFPGFAERTQRGGAGDRTLRRLVAAQRSRR